MVKIAKFFGYVIFFFFALALFAPKEGVYFLLEKELSKYDVVITDEQVREESVSLHLEGLNVWAKGVESMNIESADVTLLLLYNKIELQNIALADILKSYVPTKIETLQAHYSILDPLHVKADALGEFGEASVSFDVLDRSLTLKLKPSKQMLQGYKSTMRMLKKDENGEYSYAKTL